jgi:Holliday junction resolvase RusA-like endonuclease
VQLTLPLNPMPAPRPRVTSKGWTYYPKRYQEWRESAEALIPDILSSVGLSAPLLGALEVTAEFVVTRPKITKFRWPRADIDNYTKSVLDALNGLAFEDDQRITVMHASKRWAEPGELGFIQIEIKEIDTWP